MRSFFSMWIGLVAMKVWMRPDLAGLIASPARRMSFSLARASEQTVESLTVSAIPANGVEIAGRGGGKASLDDVDLHALQLARHAQLLFLGHGGARALLAVAQGRVENHQVVFHVRLRIGCVKSRSGVMPSSAGYCSNCGSGNLARAAQQRPGEQEAAEKQGSRQEECNLKHEPTIARFRRQRKGGQTSVFRAPDPIQDSHDVA